MSGPASVNAEGEADDDLLTKTEFWPCGAMHIAGPQNSLRSGRREAAGPP
jgi:hypothetical protein